MPRGPSLGLEGQPRDSGGTPPPPEWLPEGAFSFPHLVCVRLTFPCPHCRPMGAKVGGIRGVLSNKHFTTRKKELVEGTKSQIKGNAKAKVII